MVQVLLVSFNNVSHIGQLYTEENKCLTQDIFQYFAINVLKKAYWQQLNTLEANVVRKFANIILLVIL